MNLLVQWRTLHTTFDEHKNTFQKNHQITILSGLSFSQANSKLDPQAVMVSISEDTDSARKQKYLTFILSANVGILLIIIIQNLCE